MRNIYLDNPIDIKMILEEYNYSVDSVVNISIGYNDAVYILLSEKIPDRINGMFIDTKANTNYYMIILTIDWFGGELLHQEYHELGKHMMNFHFIQPIKDKILLLGARTYYRVSGPEHNAVIVSEDGSVHCEMCLGDGIEDCIVMTDGRIVTSYFDEGVIGNHGWDIPIGHCGLIVWDELGNRRWESNHPICDCYAINIDEKEHLWFYYYTEFALVKTDFKKEIVFHPDIRGAFGFLLSKDSRHIIFNNGYNNYSEFTSALIRYDKIGSYERTDVIYNEEQLSLKRFKFRSSEALFWDNKNRLFFKDIIQL